MTTDGTTAPPVHKTRGKVLLSLGVVALLLGIVGIVLGIVVPAGTTATLQGQLGTVQKSPATITSDLSSPSTYGVYETTSSPTPTVQVTDITVNGPDGGAVTVNAGTGEVLGTLEDGQRIVEVATFDVATSGSYSINTTTEGAAVTVALAMSTVDAGLGWSKAVGIGAGLAFLGLVLLIVGAVLMARSRKK